MGFLKGKVPYKNQYHGGYAQIDILKVSKYNCLDNFILVGAIMTFKLDDSLGFVLNRTNIKLKNALIQSFKPYDVTPEQWGILKCLWEQEGITPKCIAELTFKDQPTTVRILDKLENKGLIFREVNLIDNRSYLIYLTARGKELKNILIPLAKERLDNALKGIDEQDVQKLFQLLNRIYENLYNIFLT
jgi:DNA-binding MarR family transcriptional regulator